MARSPGGFDRRLGLGAFLAACLVVSGCEDKPTTVIDPKTRAEGLYIHGTTLYLNGQFDESIKAFEEMKTILPDDPRLPAAFGEVYLSQGKLNEALAQFEAGAKRDPKRSTNWSRMGFIQAQLGKGEEARSSLRKAIGLNPRDFTALEALGDLEVKDGNVDAAVKNFQLAAEASPNAKLAGELTLRASRELQKANREADALKVLQGAVGRGSASVEVLTEFGELLIRARRFEDAVPVLTEAAQNSPRDPTLWEMVGELYLSLDRPGDAIAAFKASLKVKDRALVHLALARVHKQRGDTAAAEEELNHAIDTATGEEDREPLELARVLAEFGRKRDALKLLETLSTEPQNAGNVELHLETAKLAKELDANDRVAAACAKVRAADAGVLLRCP